MATMAPSRPRIGTPRIVTHEVAIRSYHFGVDLVGLAVVEQLPVADSTTRMLSAVNSGSGPCSVGGAEPGRGPALETARRPLGEVCLRIVEPTADPADSLGFFEIGRDGQQSLVCLLELATRSHHTRHVTRDRSSPERAAALAMADDEMRLPDRNGLTGLPVPELGFAFPRSLARHPLENAPRVLLLTRRIEVDDPRRLDRKIRREPHHPSPSGVHVDGFPARIARCR